MRWLSALALFLTLHAAPRPAFAEETTPPPDRVVLKNGDVLHGTVLRSADGALFFEHPELGTLSISLERVVEYGPAEPVDPDEGDRPSDPTFASMEGPKHDAEPEPAPGSTAGAAGDKEAPKSAEERAREEAWQVFVSLAFAGTFNVNDEISLRAGAGASRRNDAGRFAMDAQYYFRTLNSETTDNNLLVNAIREWFFSNSPWLLFAEATYQYDEFQSWEHRVSLYGGAGYRVFDSDDLSLTLRAGAGATYEFGPSDWSPQLLFAEDFLWRISPRQTFSLNSSIAPDVTDLADYILSSQIEYAVAVGKSRKGVSFTTGARVIYDSVPADDAESMDFRVYAGFKYDF